MTRSNPTTTQYLYWRGTIRVVCVWRSIVRNEGIQGIACPLGVVFFEISSYKVLTFMKLSGELNVKKDVTPLLRHWGCVYSASWGPNRNLRDRINPVQHSRYLGTLRRHAISSHDIDYVQSLAPCLTWARILTTCVMWMWDNDINVNICLCFLWQI